ncbi:HAD-IB family hydrolase [Curtobacterium sp. MCPF17_021]|uniref:HAD family hydrolase n=1 Tax=Curtobacterium sp. MCPF17_021 TaxID=2175639 RepID=UPI000DAA9E48|nr:HAD-IB family hydrolase [Curtobacterium sp. MCPF17_021]WIE83471.1 HAD-IB family hydrolase [Curtobacterium sp. MCPF17_021]
MTEGVLRRAAFFDVDGTLTRTTTMFDLLHFDAIEQGSGERGEEFIDDLRRMQIEDGVPREAANRHYFSWWRGRSRDQLSALIARWCAQRAAGYFHLSTLEQLHRHRERGDLVVFVSGSVPLLLDDLAEELGAGHVLATSMVVSGSVFTGEVDVPMIGSRKTDAIRQLADEEHIDLTASAAYGDHLSDVPFLELVGEPVICGVPRSTEWCLAQRRGWATLLLDG